MRSATNCFSRVCRQYTNPRTPTSMRMMVSGTMTCTTVQTHANHDNGTGASKTTTVPRKYGYACTGHNTVVTPCRTAVQRVDVCPRAPQPAQHTHTHIPCSDQFLTPLRVRGGLMGVDTLTRSQHTHRGRRDNGGCAVFKGFATPFHTPHGNTAKKAKPFTKGGVRVCVGGSGALLGAH